MSDDVNERVARAYDAARCAAHGPSCQPMSERNLQTIMPMIAAALQSLRAGDRLPGGLVVMPEPRNWGTVSTDVNGHPMPDIPKELRGFSTTTAMRDAAGEK